MGKSMRYPVRFDVVTVYPNEQLASIIPIILPTCPVTSTLQILAYWTPRPL
jgi:hypothetical protein